MIERFFVDKNSLQSIDVKIVSNLSENKLKPLFNGLSKLSELKEFKIFSNYLINNSFNDYFIRIANNNQNLEKIELKSRTNTPEVIENVFNSFKQTLKTIKTFNI